MLHSSLLQSSAEALKGLHTKETDAQKENVSVNAGSHIAASSLVQTLTREGNWLEQYW